MKVWILYFKGEIDSIMHDYDNGNLDESNEHRIYAITNAKSLYKDFISQRNANKFKVHKTDMLPSEYRDLASKYTDRVLSRRSLMTRCEFTDEITYIDIVITEYENSVVNDDDMVQYLIFDPNLWNSTCSPICFNKKVLSALETLDYVNAYKYGASDPILPERYDDYSDMDFHVDEFQLLVDNFSGTFF